MEARRQMVGGGGRGAWWAGLHSAGSKAGGAHTWLTLEGTTWAAEDGGESRERPLVKQLFGQQTNQVEPLSSVHMHWRLEHKNWSYSMCRLIFCLTLDSHSSSLDNWWSFISDIMDTNNNNSNNNNNVLSFYIFDYSYLQNKNTTTVVLWKDRRRKHHPLLQQIEKRDINLHTNKIRQVESCSLLTGFCLSEEESYGRGLTHWTWRKPSEEPEQIHTCELTFHGIQRWRFTSTCT